MGTAFAATLAVAVATIILKGAGENGVSDGLRLTARVVYLFFWPAYVGGALARVFGAPFDAVARRAREFGLAFASALIVHLGLVVWLAVISPPQPFLDTVMPFFAIGVIWAYLLAFSSTEYARTTCAPDSLRVFRIIGLEYIALTFFTDFVILPQHPLKYPILYIPFWAMLGVGPCLRLTATLLQRRDKFTAARA